MIQKFPQEEFLKTFEKVPRLALNLLVEDNESRLLLTKRSIPPEVGKWHYPGSFLLKGETLKECLQRIAKDELGYDLQEEPTLTGVFENMDKDSRGHIVDIMYTVKLPNPISPVTTEQTAEAAYFSSLPENMGFNHRVVLEYIGYR